MNTRDLPVSHRVAFLPCRRVTLHGPRNNSLPGNQLPPPDDYGTTRPRRPENRPMFLSMKRAGMISGMAAAGLMATAQPAAAHGIGAGGETVMDFLMLGFSHML